MGEEHQSTHFCGQGGGDYQGPDLTLNTVKDTVIDSLKCSFSSRGSVYTSKNQHWLYCIEMHQNTYAQTTRKHT